MGRDDSEGVKKEGKRRTHILALTSRNLIQGQTQAVMLSEVRQRRCRGRYNIITFTQCEPHIT